MAKLTKKESDLKKKFGKIKFTVREAKSKEPVVEEEKPYIPTISGFRMARRV